MSFETNLPAEENKLENIWMWINWCKSPKVPPSISECIIALYPKQIKLFLSITKQAD